MQPSDGSLWRKGRVNRNHPPIDQGPPQGRQAENENWFTLIHYNSYGQMLFTANIQKTKNTEA